MTRAYSFAPIGIVRSCFKEKFGVARQSLMVTKAFGVIKLNSDFDYRLALEGLAGFSHLWVTFVFHKNIEKGWTPTITPPRIEVSKRVGVLASRSPHRPNPLGLSCVKLECIDTEAKDGVEIHVSGLDILDGSPVLDIKPYLAYTDSVPDATSGWAGAEIPKYPVSFSQQSLMAIEKLASARHPELRELLLQILELDPRPTSQRQAIPIDHPESEGRRFAFRLFDFDVQWQIQGRGVHVVDLIL